MFEILYINKDGLIFVVIISVVFIVSKFFFKSESVIKIEKIDKTDEKNSVSTQKGIPVYRQNRSMRFNEKGEKLRTKSITFLVISFAPILIFLVINESTQSGGYGAMAFLGIVLIVAFILFCVFALTSLVFYLKFKKYQKSCGLHKK